MHLYIPTKQNGKMHHSEIFAKVFFFAKLLSFVKIKSLLNGEITLSFTDIVKSYSRREFLDLQICYLSISTKIKFSRKFPDLLETMPTEQNKSQLMRYLALSE